MPQPSDSPPPDHEPPDHGPPDSGRPDSGRLEPAAGAGSTAGPVQSGEPARSGPDLARAMLDAAQARRRSGPRPAPRPSQPVYSGAGPDPRDPQPIGTVLGKLVAARGWQRPAAEATVFGRWAEVVGSDIADHCRPTKLERGELTVEAESTAWATQLRLLAPSLLAKLTDKVGAGVVTRLRIHGPASPSWSKGPRRVRGRGPRDTYG